MFGSHNNINTTEDYLKTFGYILIGFFVGLIVKWIINKLVKKTPIEKLKTNDDVSD